uniref:Uncharacterized protein n=1 Tax=Panagrolaimus sp. ES5 TaxID=591445 RepID=A0AC34FCY8_9BILA
MAYVDRITDETIYTNLLFFKNAAHKRQITLSVNEGSLPSYKAEAKIHEVIKNLPQTLNEKDETIRMPVIAFFDNSSVICIWNADQSGYEFLDSWNGIFGNELLIAFDKEKPSYCTEAVATIRSKPTFVVSDLLNVMSKSSAKPFYPFGFKITEDSENPVLIEFDNFDGTRKVATPVFLMALLLKQHIKMIKNETVEKPAKIGFCLPLEKDAVKQMHLQNQIKESFTALKSEGVFIEI